MATILELSQEINENAKDKGFWDNGIDVPEKLMLIVSELSEALEADRKDRFCKSSIKAVYGWKEEEVFLFDFKAAAKDTFEDELADAAIRLFDLAFQMDIDLEMHIRAKMRYNTSREKMHGKKY